MAMPDSAELAGPVGDWTPTDEDVTQAVSELADVFADFPIDGMTRDQVMAALGAGENVPSFCALIALVILPFMRELVDNPTPGHFLTKSSAGTGASLLLDVVSIIATGEETPAMALPEDRAETDKTITTILAEGREIAYFNNIDHSVDSGTLASAITAPRYAARILGRTQSVDVPVRCVWVFTGNNVTMTGELLRRCVPIQLDAKVADPTTGRGFKHGDIRAHVRCNRWNLVSAVLTLIQNWIAEGQPACSVKPLASFEDWTRNVGGVIERAGLSGFPGNLADWKDASSDDTDDGIARFVTKLAEPKIGTVFRPSGDERPTS